MMSLQSRRELLAIVAPRYRAAQRQERTRILEEFLASTGYHRKYALTLLNHPVTKAAAHKKRQRVRRYPFAVQQALISCWRAANGICSKRLVPYLPELVAVLGREGELCLDEPCLPLLSERTSDTSVSFTSREAKGKKGMVLANTSGKAGSSSDYNRRVICSY